MPQNNLNNILGIIGNPLKQTMSPYLHNYWLKEQRLDCYYTAFNIKNLKNIDKAIKIFNIRGLNVTIPHKVKIIKYLDDVDENARKIGAVNTINNDNGKLIGYNTDIFGFERGLSEFNMMNYNRPVILIGAGGSSEAIICALKNKGIKEIYLMNRTKNRARKIIEKHKNVTYIKWLDYNYLNEAELIVNATSLGMIGNPKLDIEFENLKTNVKVYDIVYNPINTELIKKAKLHKKQFVSGLSMFLYQAQKSFHIWFNKKVQIDDTLKKRIISKIQKI